MTTLLLHMEWDPPARTCTACGSDLVTVSCFRPEPGFATWCDTCEPRCEYDYRHVLPADPATRAAHYDTCGWALAEHFQHPDFDDERLSALLDLVARLKPGWELHLLDDIGRDLGLEPEATLLRPYNSHKVVHGAMRRVTAHRFDGYDDPFITRWETELDRLTAIGKLLRPSSSPIWRRPLNPADAYPPDHNPLHLCFVVAHMNLFGSTFAKARREIAVIYRREYGRPPPPAKPLPADELPMVEALALTLTPRQRRAIIWD